MMTTTNDPDGTPQKVDETFRSWTRSISESEALEASLKGKQFIVTSGKLTLTSANASAVLLYKNEETVNIIIDRLIFGAAVSASGTTNMCEIGVTLNPSDLSSSAGEPSIINSNLGSSLTLITTNSEKGAEAATVTDGTPGPTFFWPDKLTTVFDSVVILQPGNSIAFSVTPPASNSSLVIAMAFNAHKQVVIV